MSKEDEKGRPSQRKVVSSRKSIRENSPLAALTFLDDCFRPLNQLSEILRGMKTGGICSNVARGLIEPDPITKSAHELEALCPSVSSVMASAKALSNVGHIYKAPRLSMACIPSLLSGYDSGAETGKFSLGSDFIVRPQSYVLGGINLSALSLPPVHEALIPSLSNILPWRYFDWPDDFQARIKRLKALQKRFKKKQFKQTVEESESETPRILPVTGQAAETINEANARAIELSGSGLNLLELIKKINFKNVIEGVIGSAIFLLLIQGYDQMKNKADEEEVDSYCQENQFNKPMGIIRLGEHTLYSAPSKFAQPLAKLSENQHVIMEDEDKGWLKVSIVKGKESAKVLCTGWVESQYCDRVK